MRSGRKRALVWGAMMLVSACASDELPPDGDVPQEPAEEDDYGVFARGGIELTSLSFDQGVAITIFEDGVEIPLGERRTTAVGGRPALLRAFWVVPDDWEAREIEARLRLHYPDGTEQAGVRTLEITDDSVPRWYDGAYSFYLPAELVVPGMEIDVTLYEVDEPPDDSLPPAVVPRLPAEGSSPIDPDPSPREIDVVIVPIDHQFDGGKMCPDEAPTFDAARLQGFADALFAQTPVQRATVTVRPEPLVWAESAMSLSKILDRLSQLREEDDAPPWVYYYAAIEPCDWGSDAGFAGLAYVPKETTKSNAYRRVSIGDIAVSESATIETFVHEIGHNQERKHVPCGGPKGAVEDYPYRGGMVGSYGFDLVRWVLHLPSNRDYMSYCGPAWLSDYGWNIVLPVTSTLTSWKVEGASAPIGPGFVVGALYPDGSEAWWTMPGTPSLDPASSDRMEFFHGPELLESTPMEVTERDDGSLELVAPLPAHFDDVTALRPVSARADQPVTRERIRLLHDPATH